MPIDPEMIRDHLAMAEKHAANGEKIVNRQRELVTELQRDGHDSEDALSLLKQFEEVLRTHIADRDRLRGELTKKPPPPFG